MKTFELRPTRGQKSFYGKARVTELESGEKILTSYYTNVAMIDSSGKAHRLWGGWSVTTSHHVNSFLETYGLSPVNKHAWLEMPVE